MQLRGQSPLGRSPRLLATGDAAAGPWPEIVGVVPDLALNPGDPTRAEGIYVYRSGGRRSAGPRPFSSS